MIGQGYSRGWAMAKSCSVIGLGLLTGSGLRLGVFQGYG